jgi:hypothetical protein
VHAKGPGFVGAGRDHAPAVRIAADDHRLAAQFGTVPLFDRGEEGVHVDVNDLAAGQHDKVEGGMSARLSPLTLTARTAIIEP